MSTATIAAIVTGHSRGLGAALATELSSRGARVLGLSRGGNPDLAAHLEEVRLDLGDPDALAAWLATGRLARFLEGAARAILINNAGTVEPIGPAGRLDPAAIARAVALNATAPLVLTDAFAAATAETPDRRILNISSGAGRSPIAGWSVYCATKAALDHHARTVAEDRLATLRIASIAPGVVDTAMQAAIRATPEDRFAQRDRFVALKETGALAAPEDCARTLVDHLLGPAFGNEAVGDVRTLA